MHKLQALPSPFPDFQMIQGKTEHLGRVGRAAGVVCTRPPPPLGHFTRDLL